LSLQARLQQGGRWALAALALAALATVYTNAYFPTWIPVAATIVAIAALVWPREMLVAIAAVGPVVNLSVVAAEWPILRAIEALVLAVLAGWLVRRGPRPAGPLLRRLLPAAIVLIAILVTSSAALAIEVHAVAPQEFASTMHALSHWYLWTADTTGVVAAVMLIEGVLLTLAIVDMAEAAPRLAIAIIEALGCGGAIAALLTMLLATGLLPDVFVRHVRLPNGRFAAHVTDVNAAGSYFAMLIGLGAGMAASTRGTRRRVWLGTVGLLAVGLTLTGSRSAFVGATAVPIGAALVAARRRMRIDRRATWALAILVGGLAIAVLARAGFGSGSELRQEFTVTSLRMIAARPIFGLGIGRYYDFSRLILTPRLGVLYGNENAHDYYLQIAAEIGLAGFAAFAWWLFVLLRPMAGSVADRSRDFVSAGLLVGAAVFLITSLSGHPFLVREAAIPFWMLLGAGAIASRVPISTSVRDRSTPRSTRVAWIAAALLVVSLPLRPETPRLRLRPGQDGFGEWRTGAEGRVRDMTAFAAIYIGPKVTGLEITMRLAPDNRGHASMLVVDQEPGFSQHWTVVGRDWTTVHVELPGAAPLMAYQRINMSVLNRDGSMPADPNVALIEMRDVTISSAIP